MNESDILSEQVKNNLLDWLDKYQDRGEIFFDFPYTPSFGHYQPNLLYTDPEDNAGKPGQHWDGTQTAFDIQEPPTAHVTGDGNIFKGIGWLLLLYLFLIPLVMWLAPEIWRI